MAKVNIFVSSTCYDLSQIRNDIRQCITDMGHTPILSEVHDFPVNPNLTSVENCISAVKNEADIFVLIIGNKYGSILDSGNSITNTEFLTAIEKGIPIYTFARKEMINILPVWEKNKDADFSQIVDTSKIFEFLSDVRKKRGLWNFEFDNAQDIMEILKVQLSNLFKESLNYRNIISRSNESELFDKISSASISILLKKEDCFEIRFFMQAMHDEIQKHTDLKNDYTYTILYKIEDNLTDAEQTFNWLQFKLNQLMNYISSINNILKAFVSFYAEPGTPSDIKGLLYVAKSFAKMYAQILQWGMDVKGVIVPSEFKGLMDAFSALPSRVISQIEEYPIKSLNKINECIKKEKQGEHIDKKDLDFGLILKIDDKALDKFHKEMELLKNKMPLQ